MRPGGNARALAGDTPTFGRNCTKIAGMWPDGAVSSFLRWMEFPMRVRPGLPARCAALAAAGALTFLTCGTAFADSAAGDVVTLPEQADGVVISCGGNHYTFDLDGAGQLNVGQGTVVGGVTRVPVTTEAEQLLGYSPAFGDISATETRPLHGDVVEQPDGTATEVLPVDLTITINHDPCRPEATHALREPVILTTKDPAKLIGKLTQFPPRGDLYQLQNPVDLVMPDDPDTTIATIQKFPVKVGGL